MSMVLVKCPKCRFPNAPDLTVCRGCRRRFVVKSAVEAAPVMVEPLSFLPETNRKPFRTKTSLLGRLRGKSA